jgi:PEP-CTERM motif
MKARCLASLIAVVAILASVGVQTPAQAGSVSYLVTVYSNGYTGSGYLEAILSSSAPQSPSTVTATISDATGSFGSTTVFSGVSGNPTGSFSSTLSMNNNSGGATFPGLIDIQQVYNFPASGTSTFKLTLSGSEVGSSVNVSGTFFSLLIENSSGVPQNSEPSLNGGPSPNLMGEALDIYVASPSPFGIYASNYIEEDTFSGIGPNGNPYVTLQPLVIIPEPSSVLLLGVGIAGIVTLHRFRKRRAA